ncbi:MAG: aminotransferase class I/II-fold pyridoxal phosphate-dependent enzyme [Deltaproteobacteria bacterium]|nr:aminotransferase class I/II-fold pyridoxal phosphate-dependent enzyme [Deltaproteobacteria bacterium]
MTLDDTSGNSIKSNILTLLKSYDHPDAESWAELISGKPPQVRLAIIHKLIPDAFLSPGVRTLHDELSDHYPELMRILEGTTAYYTAFPTNGIPSQAFSIDAHVDPQFNAGIGMAKTETGDILLNPRFRDIFDMLRTEEIDEKTWTRLRNSVFKYNNGLGAPWYREVALRRYLRDGESDPTTLESIRKALRIKPVPTYGGTTGLSVALDIGVGEECRLILPRTYWGNINLKLAHRRAIKDVGDYIDTEGNIHPDILWKQISRAKKEGFPKVAVYFNFPHNPTGIVPTREQAVELEDIIQNSADENFQIIVLCDEPYYPFVRGKDVIRVPFSYYMKPGNNRNILTFSSINGTKRDGMYGMRHSDLFILTPENVSDDALKLFEKRVLAGYMRGAFSFSCALSQYLLARSITDDPLIAIRKNDEIRMSKSFFEEEKKLVDYVEQSVNSTIGVLDQIDDLQRITGRDDTNAYGGFFVTYKLSERLTKEGITSIDLHKAGLKNNCGIISTNGLIRISGLVSADNDKQFSENLRKTIEYAINEKKRNSFDEFMF